MEAGMAAVVIVECDAQKLYDRGMGIERMDERCKMRESVGLVCFVFEVITFWECYSEYYSYSKGEG